MSLVIDSYLFPTRSWELKSSAYGMYKLASSDDASICYGIVNGGNIYKSIDSGLTWIAIGFNAAWSSISTSSSGEIVSATVTNGEIYVSTDYGQTWSARASSADWRGIALSGNGEIQFAAALTDGSGGISGLYKSSNYGLTWNQINPAVANFFLFLSITVSNDGNIVYLGRNQRLFRSVDSGLNWTTQSSASDGFSLIATSDNGNYVTSASSTQIIKSSNGGITFSSGIGDVSQYTGISMSDNGKIQSAIKQKASGTRVGGIVISLDYGVNWSVTTGSLFSNSTTKDIKISSDGKKQIAIIDGSIYTNSNFGY